MNCIDKDTDNEMQEEFANASFSAFNSIRVQSVTEEAIENNVLNADEELLYI